MNRRRYGETRIFEWFAALSLLSWAVALYLPGDALMAPQFAVLRDEWGGEKRWEILMFAVGGAWLAALFVNGTKRQSPFIRAFCCVVGASVWTFIAAAIAMAAPVAGYISTGFYIYGLMGIFCLVAAGRAVSDAWLLNR